MITYTTIFFAIVALSIVQAAVDVAWGRIDG